VRKLPDKTADESKEGIWAGIRGNLDRASPEEFGESLNFSWASTSDSK